MGQLEYQRVYSIRRNGFILSNLALKSKNIIEACFKLVKNLPKGDFS